jgi:mitotic spindle assembly checkpoint protein MAD2
MLLLLGWLLRGEVQRLVLVVTGSDSGETLERWVFNVHSERPALKEQQG